MSCLNILQLAEQHCCPTSDSNQCDLFVELCNSEKKIVSLIWFFNASIDFLLENIV